MPTEAVEKPVVEETKDDSGSGSDTDSEDSMPDLEDQDVAQQSRVRLLTSFALSAGFQLPNNRYWKYR